MTRSRLLLLGAAWLALLAFAGREFRTAAQLRSAHALAAAEQRRLRAEADTLRLAQAAAAAELAQAEQQLAAFARGRESSPASGRRSEIADWLGRTKRLRQLFAEKPEAAILEMQLLTEDEWLRVTKYAEFDTERDRRRAMSAIRAEAGRLFGHQLIPAIRAYAKDFPDQKPAHIQALIPFFKQPPDPAILDRYELQDPSGPPGLGPATWFAQNKTPVDLAYDSRFRVGTNTTFQNVGAHAWIPDYHDRYRRAEQDYGKANAGQRSDDIADIIPFFHPPLAPDVAASLILSEARK